jgi:hypothetical protein
MKVCKDYNNKVSNIFKKMITKWSNKVNKIKMNKIVKYWKKKVKRIIIQISIYSVRLIGLLF